MPAAYTYAMAFISINPATGEKLWACDAWDAAGIEGALAEAVGGSPEGCQKE